MPRLGFVESGVGLRAAAAGGEARVGFSNARAVGRRAGRPLAAFCGDRGAVGPRTGYEPLVRTIGKSTVLPQPTIW